MKKETEGRKERREEAIQEHTAIDTIRDLIAV